MRRTLTGVVVLGIALLALLSSAAFSQSSGQSVTAAAPPAFDIADVHVSAKTTNQ
jgi:hypothetical protein